MPKTIKILEPDEIKRLLVWLEPKASDQPMPLRAVKVQTLVILMLETGIRVGEVTKLVVNDLFCNNAPVNSIIIRAEIAKNHTEREIPTSTTLYNQLSAFGRYFPTSGIDNAFGYSVRQTQRLLNWASWGALNQPLHPHTLRHTFATRMMRVTSSRIVQQLLGHKHLSSTEVYTHPNSLDLREAINKSQDLRGI
jgi:integrase